MLAANVWGEMAQKKLYAGCALVEPIDKLGRNIIQKARCFSGLGITVGTAVLGKNKVQAIFCPGDADVQ